MKDYQDRVKEEKTELDGRIAKLERFLVEQARKLGVADAEVGRMTRQLCIMRDYSNVLADRIYHFDNE